MVYGSATTYLGYFINDLEFNAFFAFSQNAEAMDIIEEELEESYNKMATNRLVAFVGINLAILFFILFLPQG